MIFIITEYLAILLNPFIIFVYFSSDPSSATQLKNTVSGKVLLHNPGYSSGVTETSGALRFSTKMGLLLPRYYGLHEIRI